ncbi:protein kinase [Streptomyces sp. SID10853]|uniref:serine/threonine protein kinase n=1 Tax=Streptomyces sp. SID10853 TaxID=2706028 RepID=UPI0013BF3535|nr:serine/threonine-protein kinase [Streptomyces sp. SID10853]NDZ78300.1 protein kinase [Streptomyces sp. SID10853]
MIDSTIAESLGADDPQEIGSFNIIGLLGVGGMGEVYLGASDKGYAAVKRVRPRLVSSERFEREVGILYRVPAGVGPRVLASDGTAERPWFATEYVPGLTVDEAVRLRGPLPAAALWLLLAEAASHLSAVHTFGIVHRDVKPGNVMLVRDGVKLIDFGIARAADQERLTKSGGGYGTQGFSAPEQQAGDGDVGAPADIYSLGTLVLYAASGRTPGAVPDAEPLRAVDADLAAVIGSCLATGPGARPTARELVEAVRTHLPVPPPSWPSEVMSRIASRRAFAATPVGKLETVPPPDLDAGPVPETAPPAVASPRHPRKRLLLLPAAAVIALGAVAAFVLLPSASRDDGAADPSDSASAGVEPVAGATRTPSASPSRSASPTAESGHPGPAGRDTTLPALPAGPAGPGATVPPSARSTRTPSAPVATAGPSAPATHVTASSINGINGSDDPAQVKGSEADTAWVGNDATCSAWLDDNGSGELAGVLNTSLKRSCDAELHRSDGIAYTFHASWGAAKTNFISDVHHTMWICVWSAGDRSDEQCSARFAMNDGTPVKD